MTNGNVTNGNMFLILKQLHSDRPITKNALSQLDFQRVKTLTAKKCSDA